MPPRSGAKTNGFLWPPGRLGYVLAPVSLQRTAYIPAKPAEVFYRVMRGPMAKKVLIADDSSAVRSIIKAFLDQNSDLEVCGEAADGFEAVEQSKVLKPDLVLLDLAMPQMNGAEAASILKKQMPDVAIILFTMYSEDIGRSLTSAIGVDAVLSKPDGMTALVKTVNAVLNRGSIPANIETSASDAR
jgi:DNA-binding NarL/FixJ family response regulator